MDTEGRRLCQEAAPRYKPTLTRKVGVGSSSTPGTKPNERRSCSQPSVRRLLVGRKVTSDIDSIIEEDKQGERRALCEEAVIYFYILHEYSK